MEIKEKSSAKANLYCLLTCSPHVLSRVLVTVQFTCRDMPLQKSSGIAILVSLQECGWNFPAYNRAQDNQLRKATAG